MTLVNSIFTWLMKKRIHQIELFIKYPIEVQQEWFRSLTADARETEWDFWVIVYMPRSMMQVTSTTMHIFWVLYQVWLLPLYFIRK